MFKIDRRDFLSGSIAFNTALGLGMVPALAQGQSIKFLLLTPLSGPNARSGALMRKGAELAVADVNAAGGIAALGGAKLEVVVADAGDSPERAKSAAQRVLSEEPSLVAGLGAWLSSFTLAATEISERAGLPWMTYSYSDLLTARDFKHIYQTAPVSSALAKDAIPAVINLAQQATGARPKRLAAIADSSLPAQSVMKAIREKVVAANALELVVDETYTPPLTDATSIAQKVRRARPDILLVYATTIPDLKVIIEKLQEFQLGGAQIPIVTVAPQNGSPEVVANIKPNLVEGMVVVVGNWEGVQIKEMTEGLRKRAGEPWLTEDFISTYGQVWLLKDALERAKIAEKAAVSTALRQTDLSGGASAARYFVGGTMKFDAAGRRVGSPMVVLQWQNGVPVVIGPSSDAVAKAIWKKA
ncbi:MAG: ABC transporter substrate-binding protein [Bosea sp.]|uniref:ABC transporter substrate-binding protein n=1 Tax=Bosea sp. (in: a-proteobacteria) TaxID=1871050 RepID=UPI001ACC7C49|nr:ABC transporter substrate-binding protein [Bosea sp. (in: a-proteobacteria)]MBN9467177.1 ABC transporter substrate-binding protein [Bosea sp. (in: a-proteobacteria)]